MSDSISQLTDDTFATEIDATTEPVLVDFWAEWCGPCKTMNPILEELAAEHDGALRIAKVDVDANQQLARDHGVLSLPTMILLKDGVEVHRIVGAKSKAQIAESISDHL